VNALRKPNVLIVDDQAANRTVLRAVLKGENADIYEAANGTEALSQMLAHRFAVVLLDVMMPGLDGFELATLIRAQEETRDTPIIFVSAIDRSDRIEFEGYERGAVDFVFKPVRAPILRQKVRQFLKQHERQADLERQYEKLVAKRREFELFRAKHFADEKMAAVSRMASGIAHEVNSPLAVIATNLSFLRSVVEDVDDEDAALGLQEAQDAVNTVARIVSRLRIFGGGRDDHFGAPDSEAYGQLLQEQVATKAEAHPEVTFVAHIDEEARLFRPAPGCIQLGLELIDNAVRAVRTVEGANDNVEGGETSHVVEVHLTQDAQHLQLIVADNGIGMTEEIRAHLFEPFFTTKQEWTSTGLGLTAVFGVVAEMRGTIAVESAPGQGTVVSVTLPATAASLEEASPPSSDPVDDDPLLRGTPKH